MYRPFSPSVLILWSILLGLILYSSPAMAYKPPGFWEDLGDHYFVYDLSTGDCVFIVTSEDGYEYPGLGAVNIENHPELDRILDEMITYKFDFEENCVRRKTPEEWHPEEINIVLSEVSVLPWGWGTRYGAKKLLHASLTFAPELGDALDVWVENSHLGELKLNTETKTISIKFTGEPGTWGMCEIFLCSKLIPPSDVVVYLDNQPWEAHVGLKSMIGLPDALDWYRYYISIRYPHSEHTLTIFPASRPWHLQLSLALAALTIVAALGAFYWLRFKRQSYE